MSTPAGRPNADDDSAKGSPTTTRDSLPLPAEGPDAGAFGPALDGWDSDIEEAVEFSRHVWRL